MSACASFLVLVLACPVACVAHLDTLSVQQHSTAGCVKSALLAASLKQQCAAECHACGVVPCIRLYAKWLASAGVWV
jgi:hypothetical protein